MSQVSGAYKWLKFGHCERKFKGGGGGGGRNPGRVIFFNLTRSTGNGHILECGLTTIPFVLQKANIDVLFYCGTRLCFSSQRVIKYIIEHSAFSFLISSMFSCAFLLYLPSSSHR